jgi:ribonuclease D
MVERIRHELVVGLDVETTLDFGTLCLVQIAAKERTYIIDPFSVGQLAPLTDILAERVPMKIVHNARFERRVLAAVGLELGGIHDTLEASRRLRGIDALGGHGLAMVCERELGIVLDKGEQTSDWARRPLSDEQVQYAALDAEVLLALWERLPPEALPGDGESGTGDPR